MTQAAPIVKIQLSALSRKGFSARALSNQIGMEAFAEQLTAQLDHIFSRQHGEQFSAWEDREEFVYSKIDKDAITSGAAFMSDEQYKAWKDREEYVPENGREELIFPVPIQACVEGFFNGGKEVVQYHFGYEWEPIDQILKLKNVKVVYRDTDLDFVLNDFADLMRAEDIYKHILRLDDLIDTAQQERYSEALKGELNEQIALLEKAGYTEKKLGNDKSEGALARRLEVCLQKALQKAAQDGKPIQYFKLTTDAYFKEQKVSFSITYKYINDIPRLSPSLVTAVIDGKPTHMSCSPKNRLPAAHAMYAITQGDEKQKRALELLNYVPDGKLREPTRKIVQ